MLLKCSDRSFGRIDAMIVRGYELDVYFVGADVLFDRLGTFIVHDVEGWMVVSCAKHVKDIG